MFLVPLDELTISLYKYTVKNFRDLGWERRNNGTFP